MLTKAAKAITPAHRQAAGIAADLVIFAIDDELADLDRNLDRLLSARARRELETRGGVRAPPGQDRR